MSEAIKAIEDTMKAVKAVTKPDMLLWLDSNRGVYIPRDFAKSFNAREKAVSGVSAEDWATLEAGPDHEWYWEAWTKVTDNAVVTDEHGVKYRVHQDGDCWLIPEGMEWDEDEGGFAWPKDEEEGDTPNKDLPRITTDLDGTKYAHYGQAPGPFLTVRVAVKIAELEAILADYACSMDDWQAQADVVEELEFLKKA